MHGFLTLSHKATTIHPCHNAIAAMKWRKEESMKKEYVKLNVGRSLCFSTCGGMGNTATVVYKRIAAVLAEKSNKPYSKMMMPTKLLPATFFYHVPPWFKICSASSSSLHCITSQLGSCLRRGAGPPFYLNSLLIIFVYLIYLI